MCFALISLDEEWAAVCYASAMLGIHQSCTGSVINPTKTHQLTIAMTPLQLCKTQLDCSPTYTNNLSTLNQLLEVRACWHDLISSAGNRHVVPYSHRVTWVTGMEERLSSLCEDIKEQSPRPNTPSDHNTLPGKQPTAAGRLGGCVGRAVQRLNDILKTTDKSGWSWCAAFFG